MGRIEAWLPVVGHENYLVSDQGRVMHAKTGRILKPFIRGRGGYWAVCLSVGQRKTRNKNIHRLVADAFLGLRPKGLQTMHLDDDKSNNSLSNLRYGTQSENMLAVYRAKKRASY